MACDHKFIKELLPLWEVNHLFIGTFNPTLKDGNDANYFYGRKTNNFWCIMPQVFGFGSLKDRIEDKEYLKSYLRANKIGLTDLVCSLDNADENNERDRELISTFRDTNLEKFKISFNLDIEDFIIKNMKGLKKGGVYFTRKTNSGIKKIWNRWLEVKEFCKKNGIEAKELYTPSRHHGNCDRKVLLWKDDINEQ